MRVERPPRRTEEPKEPAPRSIGPAILFVAIAGAAGLALYLIHPVASGFRLPVGPDGPVYTWLARYASVEGLGDVPGGGPGLPALTLALGTALGTVPLQTVYLLGPVLAVACGLAGAAALEASLGANTWRAATAVALTAAFAAYLAGGWLANVALVATFLGVVAGLALAASSWRPVLLAAALVAAGGLAHRIFLVAMVAIVLLAAVAGIREARRAVGAGDRARDTGPVREALAALGGGAVAAAALAWTAPAPGLDVDTSQDGFLRRRGLRALLTDRYRERFLGDLSRAALPVLGGFLLGGVWITHPPRRTPGERFLRRLLGAWAGVTVAGVLLLTAAAAGPANRVLQFGFFLPLAAAAGVAVLARRGRLGAWIGAGAVVVFVAASLIGWSRQSPAFSPEELRTLHRAAPAIEALPPGTPLVFLVDTDEEAAAYHVTRAANVIRAGVPPERIDDVHVAVGEPADYLAGHPTLTGDPEHDAIARAYAEETAPVRERAATFVVRAFNAGAYEQARNGGPEVASGVVLLDAGAGGSAARPSTVPPPDGSTEGLGLAALVLLSPAALAVLGLLGAGWAVWGLGAAGPRAALLAAPSAGIAVTILAAVAAERLGVLPGTAGSVGAIVALGLAGYVISVRR